MTSTTIQIKKFLIEDDEGNLFYDIEKIRETFEDEVKTLGEYNKDIKEKICIHCNKPLTGEYHMSDECVNVSEDRQ